MNTAGHKLRLTTTALALVTALGALSAQAQKFSVTILQNLPDSVSVEGVAINNSGQVAGNSVDSNGVSFAVLWNGTTPTVLGGYDDSHNEFSAFAEGLNNLGDVVGYDTTFKWFADLWSGAASGQCSGGESGWPWSTASAINDAGQIVGTIGGDVPPFAVLWSNLCIINDWADLGFPNSSSGTYATSINNTGDVVGSAYLDSDYLTQHAARLNPYFKDMGTLGGTNSGANQINDRGFVVGWADIPNNRSHAALWGPHTVASDLGTLGGKTSSANGINTQGDAVGSAQTLSGASHAVLWTHKHYTAVDLNNEIGVLTKQITLTEARGTNDHCQVLANGYNNKTKVPQVYVLSLLDESNCDVVTENAAVAKHESVDSDSATH